MTPLIQTYLSLTSSTPGYSGPPPLSFGRIFTEWTFEPVAFALVVVLGLAYLAGLRRLGRAGEQWPAGRSWCFGLGLVLLVVLTMGWVGVYARTVFSDYAAQIILMLTAVPLVLALGGPVTLAQKTLSERGAARLTRILQSGPARLLTFPVLSSVLIACFPFLIYFTGWYESTLRHGWSYQLLHVVLLVVGFLFAWPLAGVDEVPRKRSYGLLMVIAFAELLVDAFPGIVVRLKTHLIAGDYYTAVHRPWGHNLLADQRLGGAVLWFAGEVAAVPLMAIMGVQWLRSDRAETAAIDEQVEKAFVSARIEDEDGDFVRPWWETDPDRLGSRSERYRND